MPKMPKILETILKTSILEIVLDFLGILGI
jgi:hypothetical protein